MKKYKKLLIVLLIVILFISTFKIYFTLTNYNFTMQLKQNIDYKIHTSVEHKILQQEGYNIHYYVSGNKNAPTIVFLHPAFSSHTCFDKQIDFFTSNNFRVITVDLLGHGLSKVGKSKDKIDKSAEHIALIMQAEQINTIHIVGVSMGSLIAQYFAQLYPQKVLSLTALGGYNINHIDKEIAKMQRKEMVGWFLRVIFSMNSFRQYAASVSVLDKEEQLRFYKSTQGFTRKSFTIMSGLNKLVAERETPKRHYPLLILSGEKDIELAKKQALQWHALEPESYFNFIENAGHCANMDNDIQFNTLVLKTIH